MYQKTKPRTSSSDSTVSEKIHLENKLPFSPKEKTGPTIDLFFHELATEKSRSQKAVRFMGAVILGLCFLFTLPLIAALIKFFTTESIFQKTKVPGRRGIIFEKYTYPTEKKGNNSSFFLGTFLKKSGLYKLPSVINIWKGQMNLVGPQPYPAAWCETWNTYFSDYYKRFAVRPGFIPITKIVEDQNSFKELEKTLQEELRYVARTPTVKEDLRLLLNISQ